MNASSSRRRLLSSASYAALAVLGSVLVGSSAHAQAVCGGTYSGTTANANLAGTTCTIPIVPGYTVNVTNNPATAGTQGTLLINASSFSTAGGTTATVGGTFMDGTGPSAFTFNAPGYTLISTVAGTYSGPTQILGGTLQGGAANVFAANSLTTVGAGGTLDLGNYTQTINSVQLAGGTIQNGTLVGAITSSGGTINNVSSTSALTTTGGTTTLLNSFNFPSFMLVGGGSTISVPGGFNVGGSVLGTGTIASSFTVTGTIAPGGTTAPGTLAVNGNVTFQGGTLQIATTPTQASLLAVNGTTTISAGSVYVNAQNAMYAPSTTYKILSSTGGVSGAFSNVSANYAYLTPTLSYDANNAYLTLVSNGQSIQSVMGTSNTTSVATVINSAPNSQLYRAFQGLTPAQAQAAANSISGEGNTSTQTAGTAATRTFTNFISDRATPGGGSSGGAEVSSSSGAPSGLRSYAALADYEANTSPIVVDRPKPPQGLRIFGTAFGGASNLDGSASGIAGQTASYYGGLIGVDYKIPNTNLLVGAAIGGSDTDFTVGARSTSGSVTGVNANVFAIATFGTFYGQSLTTLSGFSNSTTRNIAGFGGLSSAIEKASYGSFEWRQRLEVGRVFDLSEKTKITGFKVTPFAAMEVAQLSTDGYSEYNPGGGSNVFGLSSTGHTYDDARTFLGARMEASYALANGMTVRPIVRLAWVHAFTSSPTSSNTFQSIPGATFVVTGATVAHNTAETKIGAELDIRKNTVVFANFDGEFGDIEQIYGGRAGIRYSF